MKIVLSLISGSSVYIEYFMKKVDDDVYRMSSLPGNLSTLEQVLESTKAIMDHDSSGLASLPSVPSDNVVSPYASIDENVHQFISLAEGVSDALEIGDDSKIEELDRGCSK